ncbi:hypothetical protein ACIQ6V_32345 [Streptomyces sp. NPDC096198]|uniref:hypothetical protein n=1 Tax=Streptomyces sp. NPDC096198 TaxID=3366080 RepID=UPI00380636FF
MADQIAGASVTVVRGAELLPLVLAPGAVLAVVRVPDVGQRRADSARHAPDLVADLLQAGHPVLPLPAGGDLPHDVGAVVVYGYDTRTNAGSPSAAAAEAVRIARHHPVVQVAFGDPDDLAGSPADVLIAAYSPHPASVASVCRVLSGHLRAQGAVPVKGARW